jgi:hypothetical protein
VKILITIFILKCCGFFFHYQLSIFHEFLLLDLISMIIIIV